MLDGGERDKLSEIERRIAATDPELSNLLRHGQRRLRRTGRQTRLHERTLLDGTWVDRWIDLGPPTL